jgi:hypothetical protein
MRESRFGLYPPLTHPFLLNVVGLSLGYGSSRFDTSMASFTDPTVHIVIVAPTNTARS